MDSIPTPARLGVAVLFACCCGMAPTLQAQPTIISPQDVARHHQNHSFSSDFSGTTWFDLENPVELRVKVHDLHVPEQGYAELVFSVVGRSKQAKALQLRRGQRYIATLQLADIAREMLLDRGAMSRAAPARILGWPATELNQMGSSFLVDEIELLASGRRLVFHVPHKSMKKHKKARWRLKSQ